MGIGSSYAIEKKFFTEIGEMDEDQTLWGGENIELSLRVSGHSYICLSELNVNDLKYTIKFSN